MKRSVVAVALALILLLPILFMGLLVFFLWRRDTSTYLRVN